METQLLAHSHTYGQVYNSLHACFWRGLLRATWRSSRVLKQTKNLVTLCCSSGFSSDPASLNPAPPLSARRLLRLPRKRRPRQPRHPSRSSGRRPTPWEVPWQPPGREALPRGGWTLATPPPSSWPAKWHQTVREEMHESVFLNPQLLRSFGYQ